MGVHNLLKTYLHMKLTFANIKLIEKKKTSCENKITAKLNSKFMTGGRSFINCVKQMKDL